MSLFGFLKEDKNDLNENRSVSSNVTSTDDFDVNAPVVIKKGDIGNDGILYATNDSLCMQIRID